MLAALTGNIKMLQFFKCRKFVEGSCARYYGIKKLAADPDYVKYTPEYEYPTKSSSSTTIYAWGTGEHGALGHYIQKKKKMKNRGDPRFIKFKQPFRHFFSEYHDIKDIAAGFGFSAFSVKSNSQNKVWGTGINTDSQIGYHDAKKGHPLGILLSPVPINLNLKNPVKTKVTSLSAGRAHLVIVTDTEGIFTLGNNSYGQCGRTVIENEKYSGSNIIHKLQKVGNETVKSVECGQDHTLFLTENGNVYACGWGADGQTGLGHFEIQPHPERVLGEIQGENIIKISSKSDCVLAINDKGDVFGWGNSEYCQIFPQSQPFLQVNHPVHLKKCQGFGKIIDVAAAGSFCMMLNEAGEVFSWGYGILGQGPLVSQNWNPKIIPPILFGQNDFQPDCKVEKIFCGLNFSAAINSYGHIYTWGKNKGGCLGLNSDKDHFFPFRVFIAAKGKKLALGVDHSLALCHPF